MPEIDIDVAALAEAREHAARDLDRAIAAVANPLRRFQRATEHLSGRVGGAIGRPVDALIMRRLAQAGLTPWLAEKHQDTPTASLATYANQQHAKLGILTVPPKE